MLSDYLRKGDINDKEFRTDLIKIANIIIYIDKN